MTNEPTYDKQIENLKQYRTFGGDKPLPGERTPTDRFVRAAYYAENLPKPTSRDEGAAYTFSVIRNISVPFGKPADDPQHGLVARACRTGLQARQTALALHHPTASKANGPGDPFYTNLQPSLSQSGLIHNRHDSSGKADFFGLPPMYCKHLQRCSSSRMIRS
jgi:hypothetical protein